MACHEKEKRGKGERVEEGGGGEEERKRKERGKEENRVNERTRTDTHTVHDCFVLVDDPFTALL
jgi:hypothetical protein